MKLREFATKEDEVISASVYGLCSGRHVLPEVLAAEIGMSKSKMYSRLRGETQWGAAEAAAIARVFKVRTADLYDGLGGMFGPADGASSSMAELRTFNPYSVESSQIAGMAKILPFIRKRASDRYHAHQVVRHA